MNDIITDLLAIIGVVLNGLPQGLLDRIQLVKLYPQGNAEARFKMNGVKKIYFYCNHSGLYYRDLMKGIDNRRSGYDDTEERRRLEAAAKMLFG